MWKLKLKELTNLKTQGFVASQVGVSQAVVSCWLSGRHKPSLRKAPKLAEILGITLNELVKDLAKE
ncbi:helix-turn-helix transcriptional regulator [Vibrio ziniensis]|uniref:Helix-turn-helix transcriptional regulator n=1 Tax=Vibrio ziniensis TaxID=2711221 RepID=A0A6G7CN50_9VIBR|nr:helix-turn-helix transcriptional regulator [Vibrio ziniensis]